MPLCYKPVTSDYMNVPASDINKQDTSTENMGGIFRL